jgi:hypothetical protein
MKLYEKVLDKRHSYAVIDKEPISNFPINITFGDRPQDPDSSDRAENMITRFANEFNAQNRAAEQPINADEYTKAKNRKD